MFFKSPVLLFDKSKRLAVKLASSVGTGFAYWTVRSLATDEIIAGTTVNAAGHVGKCNWCLYDVLWQHGVHLLIPNFEHVTHQATDLGPWYHFLFANRCHVPLIFARVQRPNVPLHSWCTAVQFGLQKVTTLGFGPCQHGLGAKEKSPLKKDIRMALRKYVP